MSNIATIKLGLNPITHSTSVLMGINTFHNFNDSRIVGITLCQGSYYFELTKSYHFL